MAVIPGSDGRVRHYVRRSDAWSTVSPVVLPGFDERDGGKAEGLVRKALEQAGFPRALADAAALKWRAAGY